MDELAFQKCSLLFLEKLPKVFNSPISNPSLQMETINMISSHCVKYQDACAEAAGSRAHENSSADVGAGDLQWTEKKYVPFQVTPDRTVKRWDTLNAAKGMSHTAEVSLKQKHKQTKSKLVAPT